MLKTFFTELTTQSKTAWNRENEAKNQSKTLEIMKLESLPSLLILLPVGGEGRRVRRVGKIRAIKSYQDSKTNFPGADIRYLTSR